MTYLKSPVVKRSLVVAGHKTSISLEEPFWTCLKDIARAEGLTIQQMVSKIDGARDHGNLSSAVRLFVLQHFRSKAKEMDATAKAAAQRA